MRGFTFVEVLAAASILALLMAVGVPAFGSVLASVKLTSFSNALLFDLYLTRSEAIKRNARVVLCKSAEGHACASGGGWEQGAIVFHDVNNNGQREPEETIIHREQPFSGELRMSGNLNVARYVSYGPDGQSRLASGAFQAGTITLCRQSADATEARQIVINATGRPRIQKTSVADCA
jgi:type IV fimbrial biogenesis protein FimT